MMIFLLFVALSMQARMSVTVLHTDGVAEATNVQAQLNAAPLLFEFVAPVDVTGVTPNLATLQAFDTVVVFGDDTFANNGVDLGNVLADYIDGGGHVVIAGEAFDTNAPASDVRGRFAADGYNPLTTDGERVANVAQEFLSDVPGTRVDGHFLLSDVNTFDGGSQSVRNRALPTTGTKKVAHWTTRGALLQVPYPRDPLIAFKGQVVALNYYPVSDPVFVGGWSPNTDGDDILRNAVRYLVKPKFDAAAPTATSIGTTSFTISGAVLLHQGGSDIIENGYLCVASPTFAATPDFATPGVVKVVVANVTAAALGAGAVPMVAGKFSGFTPNTNVVCRAYARNRFAESTSTFTVLTAFSQTVFLTTCTLPSLTCSGPLTLFTELDRCGASMSTPFHTASSSCPLNPVTYTLTGATTEAAPQAIGGSKTYAKGATNIVFAVTDNFGNTASCTTVVTVVDNQAPKITCPTSTVAGTTRPNTCSALLNYVATSSDNCPGETISFSAAGATTNSGAGSGSNTVAFTKGTSFVTLTATDAANNKATCQFTVAVTDEQKPTVEACPQNIFAPITPNCDSVFIAINATARDNCVPPDAQSTLQYTYSDATAAAGTGVGPQLFNVGNTRVTYSTVDASNNPSAVCQFTVSIPTLCGPASAGGSCVAGVLTPFVCQSCAVGGGLASGTVCDDRDPSTMNDHCANNKCEGCKTVNQACNDGNANTNGDICVNVGTTATPNLVCRGCAADGVAATHLLENALCDDKNPLTSLEHCIAGVCRAVETACDDLRDNNANGLVDCADVADCRVGFACNDGDATTSGERCVAFGKCAAEQCDQPGDEDGDGLINCADPDCQGKACGAASAAGAVCAQTAAGSAFTCLGCGAGLLSDGSRCDDRRSDTLLDTCSGNKCCGGRTKSVALFGNVVSFDVNGDGTFDSCPSPKRSVAPPGFQYVELIAQASVANNLSGLSAKHCHLSAVWIVDSNVVARSKINVDSSSSSSSSSSEDTTSHDLFHFSAHEVLTLASGLHVAELQLHFKPECQFTFGQVNWVFGATTASSESQLSSSE